jgi:flagellar motility protein MotE (MotC chaperone)
MNPFKKVNIFTFLLAVSSFAFVMRLVDISDFSTKKSVAESAPPSQQFQPVAGQSAAGQSAAGQSAAPDKVAAADAPAAVAHSGESLAAPDVKAADKAADAKATDAKATDPAAAPPPSYGEQGFSASEVETLQDLAKRREELDKREQQIGQREALLKAAGVEVDRKIAELNKLRSELEDLLNKQKTSEDERITSLVKIYENMKPKDAANIFNTLDMNVLLPVIGKISERKASPILAAMDPDKAREVTIKLAEQRKLPTLDDSKKAKASAPASTAPPAAASDAAPASPQ